MKAEFAEECNYWKTSKTSPDGWLQKTVGLLEHRGAPHIRDRVFIYAHQQSQPAMPVDAEMARVPPSMADAGCTHGQRHQTHTAGHSNGHGEVFAHRQETANNAQRRSSPIRRADWWAVEPDVGRVANGIPARVDRLRGLGNAVVPQVAEWIGRQIVQSYEGHGVVTPPATRKE